MARISPDILERVLGYLWEPDEVIFEGYNMDLSSSAEQAKKLWGAAPLHGLSAKFLLEQPTKGKLLEIYKRSYIEGENMVLALLGTSPRLELYYAHWVSKDSLGFFVEVGIKPRKIEIRYSFAPEYLPKIRDVLKGTNVAFEEGDCQGTVMELDD